MLMARLLMKGNQLTERSEAEFLDQAMATLQSEGDVYKRQGLLSDNHRAFTIGTDKFCSYCWYMREIAFKKGIFIPAIPFLSTL